MLDSEPDRWVGLLVALGVLAPLALWYFHDRMSPRLRNVVAIVGGLMLLSSAALALNRTALIGYLLGFGEGFSGNDDESGRRAADVLLALVGLAAGLGIALALRTRDSEAVAAPVGGTGSAAVVEEEPPVEADPPVTGTTEVLATSADPKSAYWSSHAADNPPGPLPAVPVGKAPLALFVAAFGLGLPVLRIGADTPSLAGLFQIGKVTALGALSLLVTGILIGLALVLPALAVRGRDAWAVYASFAFVAVGQGLTTAFPDTFSNEFWFTFGLGLVAGLLVPTVLRFLSGLVTDDRAALATGILVTVGLLTTGAFLQSKAARDSVENSFSGFGDDDDDDDDVRIPAEPVPTFSFPSDFPTDFPEPTFSFPTDFPTNFPTDFPTFTFPSGFPTP